MAVSGKLLWELVEAGDGSRVGRGLRASGFKC